jgi:hypothetical protein
MDRKMEERPREKLNRPRAVHPTPHNNTYI